MRVQGCVRVWGCVRVQMLVHLPPTVERGLPGCCGYSSSNC